ncbi:glycerophosphodiester phosphodiesterase family protein [Robiginitomaculum antarcticum]|uniref:glycerophosphodiester phosphodiesterase family protein n=1 Tax=Robiginitomaculum antarcticum TaxID=437507 RepID=UPI000362C36F|nr:glycerophosphodiester phosphodiesterase family protein [Robiginitomaculum antarcticum]
MKRTLFGFISSLALAACDPAPQSSVENINTTKTEIAQTETVAALPSIASTLSCLSDSGPILALHRGRDKGLDQAENALETLKLAYEAGFIMGEVDIAQIKDRTIILFHDGVWEEKTTGRGVVAASTAGDLDKILLKTPRGEFTSYRPATLSQVLDWAKGKLYLEIDFKSSANEADVVALISNKNMGPQVILIAYYPEQAARLRALAPDMMISVSPNAIDETGDQLVWLGTDDISEDEEIFVRNPKTYTAFGQFSARRALPDNWRNVDILVTDYASELMGKIGQNQTDQERLADCR